MKNKKKKLILISFIILLTLSSLCILLSESFATNSTNVPGSTNDPNSTVSATSPSDPNSSGLESAIDGLVGVLLLPAKFMILILGYIISMVMGLFAGPNNSSVSGLSRDVGITLQDILFNKVPLLDVNFFSVAGLSSDSTPYAIRNSVAVWYTSIRNLAAIILAIMAVYVGIRMAISTLAEEKAKYKTMLVDWLTSLALLFILNYIMVFTVNINNAFISLLEPTENGASLSDLSGTFFDVAVGNVSFTTGLASAIVYLLLQMITFVFFLSYLWRMIRIAFLMIISPLVTVTYSIDKMGDGKAQALNKWLKEYVYNILIQPFHCIIYSVLGSTAFGLLNQDPNSLNIANAVIAIAMMLFIYSAESIVKKIFHFESESMGETVSNAAVGMTIFSKLGGSSSRRRSSSSSGMNRNFGGSSTSNANGNTSSTSTTPRQVNNAKENNRIVQTANKDGNAETTENAKDTQRGEPVSGDNIGGKKSDGKANAGSVIKGAAKKVGKSAVKGIVNLNSRVFGAAALGSIGMSGGQIEKGISMAAEGWARGGVLGRTISEDLPSRHEEKVITRDLAKAVNSYKASLRDSDGNINISQNDFINDALNLANGSKSPRTKEEEDLRDAMRLYQDKLFSNGLNDGAVKSRSKQMVKDIDEGLVSEYSRGQRFVGKVKGMVSRRSSKRGRARSQGEGGTYTRYGESPQPQGGTVRPDVINTSQQVNGNPPSSSSGNPPAPDNGNPPPSDSGNPPPSDSGNPPPADSGNPPLASSGNPPPADSGNPPPSDSENSSASDSGHPPLQNGRDTRFGYGEGPQQFGGGPQTQSSGSTPPIGMINMVNTPTPETGTKTEERSSRDSSRRSTAREREDTRSRYGESPHSRYGSGISPEEKNAQPKMANTPPHMVNTPPLETDGSIQSNVSTSSRDNENMQSGHEQSIQTQSGESTTSGMNTPPSMEDTSHSETEHTPPQNNRNISPHREHNTQTRFGNGSQSKYGGNTQTGGRSPQPKMVNTPPPPEMFRPIQNEGNVPPQNVGNVTPQNGGNVPPQNGGNVPPQKGGNMPPQNGGNMPPQNGGNIPPQNGGNMPPQNSGNMPPQNGGNMPPQNGGNMPPQNGGNVPPQNRGNIPPRK